MTLYRKGLWLEQEDQALVAIINQHGFQNWVRVSHLMCTRSPKQCRERYYHTLKPNLNREPLTADEGQLICKLVEERGKRWAEISRYFVGRSDNAIKNWWNNNNNRIVRKVRRQSHIRHVQKICSENAYASRLQENQPTPLPRSLPWRLNHQPYPQMSSPINCDDDKTQYQRQSATSSRTGAQTFEHPKYSAASSISYQPSSTAETALAMSANQIMSARPHHNNRASFPATNDNRWGDSHSHPTRWMPFPYDTSPSPAKATSQPMGATYHRPEVLPRLPMSIGYNSLPIQRRDTFLSHGRSLFC